MQIMGVRILIVDDSALFRQGVCGVIKANLDWGVCGEAADGLEGIQKNRELVPHLIIMDLAMPRMNGIEAAIQILKEFPDVPILLLTLYISHQLVEDARNVGIRATLSKTAMHDLPDAIHAVLRGKDFNAAIPC